DLQRAHPVDAPGVVAGRVLANAERALGRHPIRMSRAHVVVAVAEELAHALDAARPRHDGERGLAVMDYRRARQAEDVAEPQRERRCRVLAARCGTELALEHHLGLAGVGTDAVPGA